MSAGDILVVAELAGGAPTALARELLGLARRLGSPVYAVCPGADDAVAAELVAHGADRVYTAGDAALVEYDSDAWTACAARVVRETAPVLVLVGHTTSGADLAPRLATRIGAGVATGCTKVEAEGGSLRYTRPCYGGNVRETVSFTSPLAIATVRGGCYDALPREAARRGETVTIGIDPAARRSRVVERCREGGTEARLEDARIVVAGGRGLDGPEGFEVLRELARELRAAVGASRVPCDLGWCPHSMQIGLTGKTVAPELYFAVGISGAGHHMAGCGGARAIVAINKDPDAAIFRDATFGIVGDYREIVPALTAAVRELSAARHEAAAESPRAA
jgi:electron transfer flavoprotein alpha subunit